MHGGILSVAYENSRITAFMSNAPATSLGAISNPLPTPYQSMEYAQAQTCPNLFGRKLFYFRGIFINRLTGVGQV